MARDIKAHYETFPDPAPSAVPVTPGDFERMDDALHYPWSWHRHRFTYRTCEGIRILDAGCGTGVSTINLAKLNPGSTVVGVDLSPHSLDLARQRAGMMDVAGVSFQEHDLENPLPAEWGKFDFIVARHMLANGSNPATILANLHAALADDGLLLATFPSATGRMPARQMQRAIDAVIPPDASSLDRAQAGLELLKSLRNDHPIRRYDASRHGVELPTLEQFAATYLSDVDQDGTLEEAVSRLEAADFRVLYVHDRGGWRPDRIFGTVSPGFQTRVSKLSEIQLTELRDALDISLHPDSYFLYACRSDFEPHIPAWPDEKDLANFESLIPHVCGIATSANLNPDPAHRRGGVTYRAVNGTLGELDVRSSESLRRVNGKKTIGEIEAALNVAPFTDDGIAARKARWLALAKHGYILLEAPNPREHVDCIHLGPIRDRLDCACPRRWVRACEIHEFCTISTLSTDDPKAETLRNALAKLRRQSVIACDRCPDYSPES